VVQNHAGKSEIIAANPAISVGVFGAAPAKWKLVELGAAGYWGWLNTFGDCHQGYCGSVYSLLAPYGKSIHDLSDIVANFEDAGACNEDEASCAASTSNMQSSLKIDATKPELKVYPLQITVSGKDVGQELTPKVFTFTFDEKKWAYQAPADYPLANKDF
jgi:hypothetical protein